MPAKKVETKKIVAKKTTDRSANLVPSREKVAVKPAAKTVEKKSPKGTSYTVAAPATEKKVESTLTVSLFDNTGKEKGTVALPEIVFGGKINEPLMAQAVRVYLANQRMGSAVTKTRGEVDGSTRKIYRQKGTGRARHGGIRAPIFVGGGTAHGPKLRDYSLDLPSKMKKAAVISALSKMVKSNSVKVVAGLASLDAKTKNTAKMLGGMHLADSKVLLVMPEHNEKVFKAARNINKLLVRRVQLLTTYDILNAKIILVMQEALAVLEKVFAKENK